MEPRKLYKMREGCKIDGVCAGIAEYSNLDVSVVRLLWVLLSIAPCGMGIVLYIVAAIILPEKSEI
ncbi:MAG: PspC domain-containing protein [Cellulosilyticaceae bacterium]